LKNRGTVLVFTFLPGGRDMGTVLLFANIPKSAGGSAENKKNLFKIKEDLTKK
jgi:hypothetical protein